ncbi:MAG: hypothetical protein NTW02_08365, partial [Cyanobium sp. LacPavin_0920_WC12_MAG_62_9]|nr:hypothetical protein [Cyanobium sp. LacPavin_0920_WC12_MAG_62_9]
RLRFYLHSVDRRSMQDNHPVLLSLDAALRSFRSAYADQPNEQTRYQVVRMESLIQQWAPQRGLAN